MHLHEGFRVLKSVEGSPPYFENCKKTCLQWFVNLAIQRGFPPFQLLKQGRLNLPKTLGRIVVKNEYTDDEIQQLTWEQKSDLIQRSCGLYKEL